jgi:hypothetical protein
MRDLYFKRPLVQLLGRRGLGIGRLERQSESEFSVVRKKNWIVLEFLLFLNYHLQSCNVIAKIKHMKKI